MSLHCFEKQDFNKFSQEQKSRVKKLFDGKRIWMTREKPNFTLSKNHKYTYLQRVKTLKSFIPLMSWLSVNHAQEIYFYLLVPSLHFTQSKLKTFMHSFY